MRLKRIMSLFLCLCIMCSISAFAFEDAKGHWAEQYALYLNQAGIFNGDDLGNANLANNIRRSEFIALLVRGVYSDQVVPEGADVFNDVTKDKWYYDVVSFAKNNGIVSGGGDGNFYPDKLITREEIVLMLYRSLQPTDGESSFTDVPKDYRYYKEISALVNTGIVNGYEDNTFKPKANATRGEATAMLCRVINPDKFIPEKEPEPEIPENPNKRLNLTWHQVYNKNVTTTGSYQMDGLDVVSPMWFKVIEKTSGVPNSYEYILGGVPNYYLQDFGNLEYMEDARERGYEVWPMLKGDGTLSGHSKFLNNETARKNCITFMKNLSRSYGFTGINLDFENIKVEDKDAYTQFVKELSVMCKEEGLVLSVDVTKYSPYGGTWSLCYDRKELAKYVDYVALMAYDENGTWSTEAGSVASLPWVEDAIKTTLEEVPAEKLLLGIPFYARLWREQNGKVVKTSAIGMETAMKQIETAGAKIVYDQKTGQNYAEWKDGEQTVKIWLEDETSVLARIELCKKYDLAGIASWSRTFENPSIWTFIKENLN